MLCRSLSALLCAASAACGGIAVIDPGPSGAGGEGGTVPTSSVTASTASGGGELPFRIEIRSALGTADCQPVITADPLGVDIVLSVDNTANPQALQLSVTGASIETVMGATDFEVTPLATTLVNAGVETTLPFAKVKNTASGLSGCSYCSETAIDLGLSLSAAGVPLVVEGVLDSFSCTF